MNEKHALIPLESPVNRMYLELPSLHCLLLLLQEMNWKYARMEESWYAAEKYLAVE